MKISSNLFKSNQIKILGLFIFFFCSVHQVFAAEVEMDINGLTQAWSFSSTATKHTPYFEFTYPFRFVSSRESWNDAMKDIKLCISKDNKNWTTIATMDRSHDNLTYKNTNYGRFTQVKTGTKTIQNKEGNADVKVVTVRFYPSYDYIREGFQYFKFDAWWDNDDNGSGRGDENDPNCIWTSSAVCAQINNPITEIARTAPNTITMKSNALTSNDVYESGRYARLNLSSQSGYAGDEGGMYAQNYSTTASLSNSMKNSDLDTKGATYYWYWESKLDVSVANNFYNCSGSNTVTNIFYGKETTITFKPLPKPANLSATTTTNTKTPVKLSWQSFSSTDYEKEGYWYIFRKCGNTSTLLASNISFGTTTYTDNSATTEQTYTYYIIFVPTSWTTKPTTSTYNSSTYSSLLTASSPVSTTRDLYEVKISAETGGMVKLNNGSSASSVNNSFYYGTNVSYSASANAGYTFKHWNDGKTSASQEITVTENVTKTASFSANEYSLTLNPNCTDYTVRGSSSVKATYAADMPSITCPERTGYTFAGYWSSNNGGTQYYKVDGTSNCKWNSTALTELFAHWTANEYTITFDNQSATIAGSLSVATTYGSTLPTIDIPAKTGYTFQGYYFGENGSGKQYYTSTGNSAITWDLTSSTTLYAYWKPNTYTISFDNQSATTVGTPSISVTYDLEMPTIVVPSKTGFTFGGYFTEPNGAGKQYFEADGSSLQKSDILENITLYSYWIIANYSITYNNMEYAVINDENVAKTYQSGNEIALPTNVSKNGCSFAGWYNNENFEGDKIEAISADEYGDKVFYAKWTPNQYPVTFHTNEGVINSGEIASYTFGIGSLLPSNVTKPGYMFFGWFDNESLAGEPISQISVAEFGDKEYWAKWGTDAYTITLNANEGTILSGNVVVYMVTDEIILPTNVTKQGYDFMGWYDNSNFEGSEIKKIEIGSTGNKEYWAKWLVKTYTITLHANDGVIESGNVDYYVYGIGENLPTDVIKKGHTFAGWFAASDFSGNRVLRVVEGSLGNKEYWAKWIPNNYTITYNINGGEIQDAYDVAYTYGEKEIKLPDNVVREGYTFAGWFNNSNLSGVAETIVGKSDFGNKEYWAKWLVNTYSISLNVADGTINSGDVRFYTYGNGANLPVDVTKTGNTFGGWYDNVECEGESINFISATEWGDKIFYAKWTPNKYSIVLNNNSGKVLDSVVATNYVYGETTIELPDSVVREGHTFAGWYNNSNYYGEPQIIITPTDLGNKEFWAKWEINSYNISLNTNGGEINSGNVASYTYNTLVILPIDVTKVGYKFNGWFDAEGNQVVSIEKGSVGDKSFSAEWSPIDYTITLYTNGGTIDEGAVTSYQYGNQTILPTNVSLNGYTFIGWYTTSYYDGLPVTEIESTEFGNKQFWARWKKNCQIEISANITDVSCYDMANGRIELQINNAIEPNLIQWIGMENNTIVAENLKAGNYEVVVTDSRECSATKVFTVIQPNEIVASIAEVINPTCNNMGTIRLDAENSYNYLWSNGSTERDLTSSELGEYTVIVTEPTTGCSITLSQALEMSIKQPEISLVTTSRESGKNLVVWVRENTDQIDYYTIYRLAGNSEFEEIGTVPYSEISVFEDDEVDPKSNQWTYAISATDVCANETSMSSPHTTLHLGESPSLRDGYAELRWDAYEGLDYSSFYVIRETKVDNFTFIDTLTTLPSSVTSYSAEYPGVGKSLYYVGIKLPQVVNPKDFLKAESGPFAIAISNIAEVENEEETAVADVEESSVVVYAVEHTIYVKNAEGKEITIYDNTSRGIFHTPISNGNDVKEYFVETIGVYHVLVGNTAYSVVVK